MRMFRDFLGRTGLINASIESSRVPSSDSFSTIFSFLPLKRGKKKERRQDDKVGILFLSSTKFANSRFRLEISKIVIRENNWNRDSCFIIEKSGLKNIKKNSEKRFHR